MLAPPQEVETTIGKQAVPCQLTPGIHSQSLQPGYSLVRTCPLLDTGGSGHISLQRRYGQENGHLALIQTLAKGQLQPPRRRASLNNSRACLPRPALTAS